jgi:hypothetical protein
MVNIWTFVAVDRFVGTWGKGNKYNLAVEPYSQSYNISNKFTSWCSKISKPTALTFLFILTVP